MSWAQWGQQLFTVFNRLSSRAVVACTTGASLQAGQQVVVKVCRQERVLHVTVSDTGRHLPDDLKVLKHAFQHLFDHGADCLAEGAVVVRSTALDESFIRVYSLKPKRHTARAADAAQVGVDAVRLPCAPKQSQTAFSGSEASFQLINLNTTEAAEEAVACIQTVLELTATVAPKLQLELRLRGFQPAPSIAAAEQLQLPPLQGQEGSQLAPHQRPANIRFDLEPLPDEMNREERFCEGLAAYFDTPEDQRMVLDPDTGCPQVLPSLLQLVVATAGADACAADSAGLAGSAGRRGPWSAQVALVMNSSTPSATTGCTLPPGQAQVYVFRNYALALRTDNQLSAFEKCNWGSFGLGLEALVKQHDGSGIAQLTSDSDPLILELSAVVIHLYTSNAMAEAETGKPPALSAQVEAKLVRAAVEDALEQLKQANPGRLASKLERRLQHCLPYLAKSLAATVAGSGTAELQSRACALMGCDLDGLAPQLELRLQDAAGREIHECKVAQAAAAPSGQLPGAAQIAAMGMGV